MRKIEVLKHLMRIREGVYRRAVDGEKPSTTESGTPTRDVRAWSGWGHGSKDQLAVLVEKGQTSGLMA